MKNIFYQRLIVSTLALILLIGAVSFSLWSCYSEQITHGNNESESRESDAEYAAIITELKNKLESLKNEQLAADSENKKKLDELKSTIESLREQSDTTSEETESDSDLLPPETPHFIYTTAGNRATVTGYAGNEENIVIPSYIDGYKVCAIADSAFSSDSLKRVIISDGIESVGWFAFFNCPSLSSVTIPASVESIGHSAFPGAVKFTVYCHESSFAHEYAKSYGLDYVLI